MNNFKKKAINILILGVSGNVNQGFIQILQKYRTNITCNIIGACIFKNSIGQYMVDRFITSPYANDSEFINWLIDVCNKEKIDIVLSGVEENIWTISNNIDKLKKETTAKFVVATPEQLSIGNDKLLTCKWLKDNGCNYPLYADASNSDEISNLLSKTKFPVIAKPRNGKGAKGIFIINNKKDLDLIKDKNNYLLEEYLGDNDSEYTVATYVDKQGLYKGQIILKRQLENGTTVFAETVNNKNIEDECKKITEKLNMTGPLNIQLRMHNGKPVCFELNIRFSGTTPIRDLLGYQDLRAAIAEYVFQEENINSYFNVKNGKIYRCMTPFIVKGENEYINNGN